LHGVEKFLLFESLFEVLKRGSFFKLVLTPKEVRGFFVLVFWRRHPLKVRIRDFILTLILFLSASPFPEKRYLAPRASVMHLTRINSGVCRRNNKGFGMIWLSYFWLILAGSNLRTLESN
jgi:hypothetical protein